MDLLERLHDSILLQVFNKVGDAKALGRCRVVSKRFLFLVSLVENVTVNVDCIIAGEETSHDLKGRSVFGLLAKLVVGSIVKPLKALHQMIGPKKSTFAVLSHHSPCEVLKNFKAIRNLRIELPGGELGVQDGVLLKWKAEFGSTLDSCVILGASALLKPAIERKQARSEELESQDQDRTESFSTNGGLRLRVVWTISSLIAASSRHYLLQQIISEHPTLASLVLTDGDGQGMLCMDKEQLQEFRNKPLAASAFASRTQVPALNIKLWYAPYLELSGGTALEGATLVVIKPIDRSGKKEVSSILPAAFDEPFKTVANQLVMRRTYLLEMNSF